MKTAHDHNPRALHCQCVSCATGTTKAQERMLRRPSGYNEGKPTEFLNADGSKQTLEAVMGERKSLLKTHGRKRLGEAFKLRAGMIGMLQSCLCDYPLTSYTTPSAHSDQCPSHALFASLQRAHAGDE